MQVRDYLFSQGDLNLTRSDEANVASNILYMMELLPPSKAPALAYLDSGGQAPLPPRQARPPAFLSSHLAFHEKPSVHLASNFTCMALQPKPRRPFAAPFDANKMQCPCMKSGISVPDSLIGVRAQSRSLTAIVWEFDAVPGVLQIRAALYLDCE